MTDHDPLGLTGELIDEKYRIEHLVGEGGFAVVYRAKHVIWDRPVAVKFFNGLSRVPNSYRETLQQQFVAEGALLTELSVQSSGIVQARDIGFYTSPDGQWIPYMVLEWLEGSSLEAILEQDRRQGLPWTEREVVGFLKRVLQPLEVAHRHGVTHRDIKPANIFVLGSAARSPETPCKLLDFGVAKMVSDQSTLNVALARTGLATTSFTPQYGAPEQFTRSYGATGPWTDVYALALVASEMLVGKPVLEGADLVQLGFASANPDLRPTPRSLGARISDPLEAVFAKALAVQPGDRFVNAGEFLASTLLVAEQADSKGNSGRPFPSATTAPVTLVDPVPLDRRTLDHDEPRAPPPARESPLGIILVLLVVLGFGTLIYSVTNFPGARETQRVLASIGTQAKHLVQRLARNEAPEVSSSALRSSAAPAGSSLAERGSSECPAHTWRLSLPRPKVPSLAATASRLDAGALGPIRCMDQTEVSEIDYAACSGCEQPKVRPQNAKLSEYCRSGRSPTAAPVRCVTWNQAAAYCRLRKAELPRHEELVAVGQAETSKEGGSDAEWSAERPRGTRSEPREFRCVVNR